jgi:hypothetical protein
VTNILYRRRRSIIVHKAYAVRIDAVQHRVHDLDVRTKCFTTVYSSHRTDTAQLDEIRTRINTTMDGRRISELRGARAIYCTLLINSRNNRGQPRVRLQRISRCSRFFTIRVPCGSTPAPACDEWSAMQLESRHRQAPPTVYASLG